MSDFIFNIAKGAAAEMVRDSASNLLVLLTKVDEAAAAQKDHDTVALLLAGTTDECDATDYVRKTGITGTVTVDDTNDRVDLDMPDQTWTGLGGATNNSLVGLIVAYENAAADTTRVPIAHLDFVVTTDDTDVIAQLNASGFARFS